MKILITGSNGLLGQHLVKLLRSNPGNEVIATARGANRLNDEQGYIYVPMDICQANQVEKVLEKWRPGAIIHTAAMTQVDDCERQPEKCHDVNVLGTKNLLTWTKRADAFLLLLSTDFIFDGRNGPYREEDPPQPISHYGQSKLDAEYLVRTHLQQWAIARTVLVYGMAEDMSRSNIILWVKGELEQGHPIRVVDDQWRTPTLVQDLAMGCSLITARRARGVFNISGKDMLTPYGMAIKTADFFGLDKSLIQKADASSFSQPARRPPRTGFILDKAIQQLGYDPHSFDEGLRMLAADLKKNPH
ncbi:MAG TPA: SDR family oxidoreductase [Chitinophagaceae bacterium]|nr:SDR family oxidoreductase [Chitinophagaceae bacterium]